MLGMMYLKSYRRWPALFALACFEVALTISLFTLRAPGQYRIYFYAYWCAEIVRGFLLLSLLYNCYVSIPGIQGIPANLRLLFISLAITISTVSAWLASHGGTETFHITKMALTMDRCIAIIWGTSALSIFGAIWFCGLGWIITTLKVASGYLSIAMMAGFESYFLSVWPNRLHPIHELSEIVQAGVWIYWLATMTNEHLAIDHSPNRNTEPHLREALLFE